MKKAVFVLALVFSAVLGTALNMYAATCEGRCNGCTLSFKDCASCSINEINCTWEYSGCSGGVHINCEPIEG